MSSTTTLVPDSAAHRLKVPDDYPSDVLDAPAQIDHDRSTDDTSASLGERIVLPLVGFAVAIAVWAAATMLFSGPGDNLYPFNPVDTARSLATMAGEATFWEDIAVSLRRLLIGLAAAVAIGAPLGAAIATWPRLDRAVGPLTQFLRMTSPLAWAPVAIFVLGTGSAPAQALIAAAAVWPLVLNTAAGVRAVNPAWFAVVRTLGATRPEAFRSVALPVVQPHLLTGLRVSLGIGWIVLVPVEMLGVNQGLGYAIINARDGLAYSDLMAVVVVIGLLGFLLDGTIRLVAAFMERRSLLQST
ncbi:MAG: ABC transporter permease [Aquihabitans sp.]